MESQLIQTEIADHFIKKGRVLKQSKYLKEWSERFLVLTQNYLFTFKTEQYFQPADVINLSYLISIKSDVPSETDHLLNDLTVETSVCNIKFRCCSSPDKWNWMVAFERLLDLRAKGDSYYNSLPNVSKRGFDSIHEFNIAYPDGPQGKYIGKELEKLCKTVIKIGEDAVKKQKQNQDDLKVLENALSEERKKIEIFEALGVGDDKVGEVSTPSEESANSNKEEPRSSLLKSSNLSQLFQQRSHNRAKQQKETETKAEYQQKTIEETVMIDGCLYKKVSKITLVPFQGRNQLQKHTQKKRNIEQLENIPKGKVEYKEQEQFGQMDSITYSHIHPAQIDNFRKSRITVGIFDEFQQNSCPKRLVIFLQLIVNLMCQQSCEYRDVIKFQSLNHNKRNNLAEIFLEHYLNKTDEPSIYKMVKFFNLIYPLCPSLFTEHQLISLKNAFMKNLTRDNREIQELSMDNLNKITCKVVFTEQEHEYMQKHQYSWCKTGSPKASDAVNPESVSSN